MLEVVAFIWVACALVYFLGTIVHTAMKWPKPTEDLPGPLVALMFITVLPKLLIVAVLALVFVGIPLAIGLTLRRLWR